jgi:hypothetical protein
MRPDHAILDVLVVDLDSMMIFFPEPALQNLIQPSSVFLANVPLHVPEKKAQLF